MLYKATAKKAYIANVNILIPDHWILESESTSEFTFQARLIKMNKEMYVVYYSYLDGHSHGYFDSSTF